MGRAPPLHVPGDVVGERANEHVDADRFFLPVADGGRISRPVLSPRKTRSTFPMALQDATAASAASALGRKAGADHVDPAEGSLGGDLLLIPPQGEGLIGDSVMKCLATFLLMTLPAARAMLSLPRSGRVRRVAALIFASSASVAASSPPRVRARPASRNGL